MSQHIRRPFAMGNTNVPVLSVPEMRGSVKKDSTGAFADLPLPAELCVETENGATAGGLSVVFVTNPSADVVAQFNTTMAGYAEAEEVEGCLVIRSVGVGDESFIRVRPPISGFDDASSSFGFETHPHPLATVTAGDLEDAPTRPRQQVNPVGTKFLAIGEDRTSSAYNRALHVLAQNSDTAYTWLRQPVARMVTLVVDEVAHAASITTLANGRVDQVDLTDLTVFDASLAGVRLYVGGLSRNSSLDEISTSWAMADSEGKQVAAGDRTVRVGAVTRGSRAGVMPTFATDASAPVGPLSDTVTVAVDGGNALGVDRVKHAAVQINEVRQRTGIVCETATFVTNGVKSGDVAVIAGAAITDPFSHDGTYLVETVVSETELVLRPHQDAGHVRELNPALGNLGTVVITSSGDWERDLWVSFSPSLPRFPESGKILLTVPVEDALGDLSLADILRGDVRGSADVAGWTILQLWRNLTLDGAYQGMAAARGSGFYANVTHRGVRFDTGHVGMQDAGSIGRSSTGVAVLDAFLLRLSAAPDDRFDVDDVGRTILLTAGPFLAKEPWTITRLIDNATVEVAPPLHRAGYRETDGTTVNVTAWDIIEGDVIDFYGAVQVVSPEFTGPADEAPSHGGFLFTREQRDVGTADPPVAGLFSFLHLEHVRLHRTAGNITISTAGAVGADDVLPLAFDPEESSNFYAENYDTKTGSGQSSLTFVRILNGPNAGLYRVKSCRSSSVSTNAVVVEHLDGTPVVFTFDPATCDVAFYNATAGVSVPIKGGPEAASTWMAAQSLFTDGYEQDVDFAVAQRIVWRGAGAGIFAYLNDPEFVAFDNGDGAEGPVVSLRVFAPAEGIDIQATGADSGSAARRSSYGVRAQAHTNRFDFFIDPPPIEGAEFAGAKAFAGYFSQTGRDPALVVVKQEASAAGDESTAHSKLAPGAALLVGRAGATSAAALYGPTGRGSAQESAGSIYVHSHWPGAAAPSWGEGGVFVEDGVGAGRAVYPSAGVYDFETFPSYGLSPAYIGWGAPTRLGNPGVVYPPRDGDPLQVIGLQPPDYTRFNFPHSGIARIVNVGALTPDFAPPYSRLVGLRLYVNDAGSAYTGQTYAIVGTIVPAANDLWIALYNENFAISTVEAGMEFSLLGERWHEAHLNVADWYMVGVANDRDNLERCPVHVRLDDVLNDEVQRQALVAVSDPDLQTIVALSPYTWAGTDGVRIGLGGLLAAMPNVDVAAGAYTAAVSWPQGGRYYVEHGWAIDSFEPRGPFPNDASMPTADGDSTQLDSTYRGSLVVSDLAISFPGATDGVLNWSSKWGGCVHAHRAGAGASLTMRIWRPGHTLVLQDHLAVKVHAIVQVSDNKTLTFALRRADGTVVASSAVNIVSGATPQAVQVTLTPSGLSAAALLHASAVGAMSGSISAEVLFVTMDVVVQNPGDDCYILELASEPGTKPELVDGPMIVAGHVLAHGFRFTDPVKGYDTRGPLDAEFLCGPGYGFATGSMDEILSHFPDAVGNWDRIGAQELDGQTGRLRPAAGTTWVQPVALRELFFAKGPHAAAVTLVTGAYDPVFYMWKTCDNTEVDNTIQTDLFTLPGRTGFAVPFDPPHGAFLTTLALAMSFRANYYHGDTDLHWGIFRDLFDPSTTVAGTPIAYATILNKATLNAQAGVYVDLWRHGVADTGFDEDQNAEYSASLPGFGYSERIARMSIDLSGVSPASWASNLVDPAAVPSAGGDVYAGKERFEKRNWDLLQIVGDANHQVLRVDRRHYTYSMTISFWGGPRETVTTAVSAVDIFAYEHQAADRFFNDMPATVTDIGFFGGTPIDLAAVQVGDGFPDDSITDHADYPPQAKFRGARLGWVTDRGGNGGWGG